MNSNQTINSFSARTVGRLMSARRATLTMLATFLIAMTAQTAWATTETLGGYNFTVETDTDGSYYVIDGTAALNALASYVNAGNDCSNMRFKVTQDFAFSYTTAWDATSSSEDNFTPIGGYEVNGSTSDPFPFNGTFDGNFKTISGIRMNSTVSDGDTYYRFRALFGRVGGKVKNVILADTRISGVNKVAGIVAENYGVVSNCHVTSTVCINAQGDGSNCIGGIVGASLLGALDTDYGIITNCTSSATINAPISIYVGGVVGSINGELTNNFVIGARINTASGTSQNNLHSHGAIFGAKNGDYTSQHNYYYNCTIPEYGVADNGDSCPGFMPTLAAGITTSSFTTFTVPAHKDIVNNSLTDFAAKTYTVAPQYHIIEFSYSGSGNTGDGYCFNVVDKNSKFIRITENNVGSNVIYSFLMPASDITISDPIDKWGVTSSANGSEANPYVISDEAGLNLLAQKVNAGNNYEGKYFKLNDNISYTYTHAWNANSENNFTAIGESNKPFSGHFDGNGKTISYIRIARGAVGYQGLFGNSNGELKGITLANAAIYGGDNVGGIVGKNDGTVTNCQVANNVKVDGTSYYRGSIAGANTGSITNCFVDNSTVSGSSEYIGAIVGTNSGTLTNNHYLSETLGGAGASGSTRGADLAGARKALTITPGTNVSFIPTGEATTYNEMTTYADNNVIKYDGIFYSGETESVSLTLSYTGDLAEGYAVGYKVNDTAISGNKFTMPAANATITPSSIDVWGVMGGADGSSEEKAYVITGTEGLDLLAQKVNAGTSYEGKYFKLGDNIAYDKDKGNNFTPIGYTKIDENNQAIERPFRGHFDGNGKTISGININNSDVDNHGIFGPVDGTVKNLVVSNCSIVADHNIGAIVGVLHGTIENCHVGSDVTLSGHKHVGGIAGWCAATIKGCSSAATITGTNSSDDNANNLGGIVGATNGPSSLTDNLFTGAITGDLGEYIGAIFGWGNENEYATLTNNVYTSAGFGGIGAKGSATGSDGAGARKAVVIGAVEGVTITPTGEATTYNVSGITTYTDNNVLGYDSKLYAGATDAVKLSIVNTGTPETGYEFSGFTAGEGVTITSSEDVYTLTVPASDVTVDVVNQAIIYNITYKGVEDEGVTFTEDNPEAYTVADESFALNNPSREGYLFTGWTYEGQDEPTKTVTIAMGSTGDKTFTANWEEFVETEVETAVTNEAAKEVEITKVMVPKGETKAVIPATVNGYTVTNIAKGAFADVTGEDHVQDIFLPDKQLINIEEGALIFDKLMEPTLYVPLELLSDYANMPGLKLFFEADKIQAMAVAADKFWTFSCGIDVKVPEGVKVYTCRMNDDKTAVLIHELTDDELGGVIKANNGVLLSSATGEYPFVVNRATAKAMEVGKSYENNLLEPVLRAKNYASGEYYVLKDNEFHPILANGSKVPACKAVLHWASSAKARLEIILGDDVKTAINGIAADEEGAEWYTVSGQRIDKPTKKGLYIKNGKKVIIK